MHMNHKYKEQSKAKFDNNDFVLFVLCLFCVCFVFVLCLFCVCFVFVLCLFWVGFGFLPVIVVLYICQIRHCFAKNQQRFKFQIFSQTFFRENARKRLPLTRQIKLMIPMVGAIFHNLNFSSKRHNTCMMT